MSRMAVDGLVSGLKTSELITGLMQVEAGPQKLLQRKSSEAAALVTTLQSLNTKVASLATAAERAAGAESWQARKVTSTSASVSATASAGAVPTTLEVGVDRLAAAQVTLLDLAGCTAPPTVSVVRGDKVLSVTAAGTSAVEVAAAINRAPELGLAAVALRVGDGVGGEPRYQLQLTGGTGAEGAFDVHVGTDAGVTGAQVLSYVADPPAAPPGSIVALRSRAAVPAADARITLWPGAVLPEGSHHLTLTSSTNTFTDVLPGVSVTAAAATKPGDPPATLAIAQDAAAGKALASGLANNIATVLGEIASRTRSTTTTSADGREVTTGGPLSGNSAVRFLADDLRAAVSSPVGGRSPSEAGFTLASDGTLTFDEARFTAAMTADPAGTQQLLSAVAARVAGIAVRASAPRDGAISLQIAAQQGAVKDGNARIDDWDRRLETRRAGLERTYARLEATLGRLQSQSSWLASQLAGLPLQNNGS